MRISDWSSDVCSSDLLFGRRWIHWHAPYHLNYFTRHSMKRLAANVGFDVEFVRVVTNSAWIEYQWAHLVTFPRQGNASPFRGREKLSLPHRMAPKMFRFNGSNAVNQPIAHLQDAFGVGDHVYFLL